MRILILGAGVIGVSSAWYLSQLGHEVTVIDRQPKAGQETSFANAGQISPGYAAPWAAPGIPLKAIKWLFTEHAPLAIRPGLSWVQYQWMAQMLRNCTVERYAINKSRMVRLSEYSRDCFDQLRASTGLNYEGRQQGTMQLFRTQQQLDDSAKDIAVLKEYNVPYQVLDKAGIAEFEPALADVGDLLVGALRLPNDQTGDCQLFTTRLAEMAEATGVKFLYGKNIQQLVGNSSAIESVVVDGETHTADRYVLALGSYSPLLVAPLGIKLPVYPLKGYSITLPIKDATRSPTSTVLDESYKVAVTRFDQRIRVGGMAEISGYDLSLSDKRRATLEKVVTDLYPKGGDISKAQFWTGLRPATPDGTPVIGATPYSNLYINTGHGTLGWTMACGSGRYLADIISQRKPEIDGEGLDIFRY